MTNLERFIEEDCLHLKCEEKKMDKRDAIKQSRAVVANWWSGDHWWSMRCEKLATAGLESCGKDFQMSAQVGLGWQ